jgi:hypothetical protein
MKLSAIWRRLAAMVSSRWCWRAAAVVLLAAGGVWLAIWLGGNQRGEDAGEPAALRERRSRKAVARQLCRSAEQLSGGRPVRIVWVENRGAAGAADPFANSRDLRLGGFDSRTGGYRAISREEGNYARPLLTPGGGQVVFTDKGTAAQGKHKTFSPRMHVINWDGTGKTALGEGFAVDVVLDPNGATTWVYALERLGPSRQQSLGGEGLFRFPLHEPAKRQSVWPRGDFSLDNVQVSRDGQRFAAIFPEREGVLGNPSTGSWHKLATGCWAGLAPDNSYVGCVFHGGHRKMRFFDFAAGRKWEVDISLVAGIKGREVFHPRWSNHPRFFTFTGPYPVESRNHDAKPGPMASGSGGIQSAGHRADVFLVRLSQDLSALEDAVRITSNTYGDFYPDAWIEEGDGEILSAFAQTPSDPPAAATAGWPATTEGAHFVWENADADNHLAGRPAPCHVTAVGIARFGRHHEMLLDGGHFLADAGSAASFAAAVTAEQAFTIEIQLSERRSEASPEAATYFMLTDPAGRPVLSLQRLGASLIWRWSPDPAQAEAALALPAPPVAGGQPRNLSLTYDGRTLRGSLDHGTASARATASGPGKALALGAEVRFGDPSGPLGQAAGIDYVGIYGRVLKDAEREAHYRMSVARSMPLAAAPRVRLLARVLSATVPDPRRLESYRRMLVDHTYDVVEVLEGRCDAKRIAVLHWGMLDRQPVRGIPRAAGQTTELHLESADDHPELSSELQSTESADASLPLYYDISTPSGLRASPME